MSDMDDTARAGSATIAFSAFHLDLRGGHLRRGSEAIPLRPKTWAVLVYLAERPGALISKEELLDAVWPDVAVTPDTLTKSIGELRLALGDDSRSPRYIETAHRRGFRFIAHREVPAPGSPVSGCQAPRTTDDESETRNQELGTRNPVFVGREAEIQRLEHHLARAHAGTRQMVFITGAAGIGKTSLLEAFLETVERGGAAAPWIGRGECVEQHGPREAYMPVLQALEQLARRPDAGMLLDLLPRVAPTWLAQIPWLAGRDAPVRPPSHHAALPARMLRELATLVETLTSDRTLILVLEDLHWSDPSTVDLLSVLAQRQEPARLLLIGSYRPAEVAVHDHPLASAVRTLRARRLCSEIPLHELSMENVGRYLAQRFPDAQFVPALTPMLHHHTDGHPLFMVGVIEHMLERGLILETAPGWMLSAAMERVDFGVPDDIARMAEALIETLSPADRELLEVASVSGIEFAIPAVAAVMGCDAAIIETRCEALARARRLLRVAGSSDWPDGSVTRRYAFSHEIYRQVLYAAIPDGYRAHLHQRLADALEHAYGEGAGEIAAVLALHYERSRNPVRAIHYLTIAGIRARQRSANREALNYFEAALAALARLPDGEARGRQELELRLLAAPSLADLHGFASDPVRSNCERADELGQLVGNPAQRFQILHALCHIHILRADTELAPKVVAQLNTLAKDLGDPASRVLADSALIRAAALHGRFQDACRLVEQRITGSGTHPSGSASRYGADPLIAARIHYAFALSMRGDMVRGREVVRAELEAARSIGSPFTVTSALWYTAFLEVLAGEVSAAGVLVEEVVALSTEHGFTHWHGPASALRGWVEVQQGALASGIATLENAHRSLEVTGARLFSSYICAFLAEAHLRAKRWDAGLAALETGLEIAESTLDRTYWPELWRLKGELLLAAASNGQRGTVREAERCLWRALDLSQQCGARLLELRAALSLARLHPTARRNARTLLARLCMKFGAGAQSRDLDEARTLLALAERPTLPRAHPASVRPRSRAPLREKRRAR